MTVKSRRAQKPRTLNLGGREVESYGLRADFWSDFAHRCLTVRWPTFIAYSTLAFLVMNCGFALLFMLGDKPVANADGDFLHYFYFSIETLATVGYGDMHPQTHYGHTIASIEMFVGVFITAVLTGLIFYRFSRPRARFLFAERAVVARHEGRTSLMIRVANERLNPIVNPSAKMWLSITVTTAEGAEFRRFMEMSLLRAQSPLFVLSWTIIHDIDEKSPIFGMDNAALEAAQATVLVSIEGHDETSAQSVRARKTYTFSDIVFGERYVDVLEPSDDDRVRLNYTKFHMTQPDD
jgi:inward rectifier potassium channel